MKSLGPAFNRMWGASLASNLADGVLVAAAPPLAVALLYYVNRYKTHAHLSLELLRSSREFGHTLTH
jgi:hypothetical protein